MCGETKSVKDFRILRGIQPDSYCKPCKATRDKAYHLAHREQKKAYDQARYTTRREVVALWGKTYREEHREEVKARKAEYYQRTKERDHEKRSVAARAWQVHNPERVLAAAKRYRERHPEQVHEGSRRWRVANPERHAAQTKEWIEQNPERMREHYRIHGHRRRAWKKGNGGSFTLSEWEAIKARYDYRCLKCKRAEPEIKLEADHVVPLSKGGPNEASNIQPLCGPCNYQKRAQTIDYRLVLHAA